MYAVLGRISAAGFCAKNAHRRLLSSSALRSPKAKPAIISWLETAWETVRVSATLCQSHSGSPRVSDLCLAAYQICVWPRIRFAAKVLQFRFVSARRVSDLCLPAYQICVCPPRIRFVSARVSDLCLPAYQICVCPTRIRFMSARVSDLCLPAYQILNADSESFATRFVVIYDNIKSYHQSYIETS